LFYLRWNTAAVPSGGKDQKRVDPRRWGKKWISLIYWFDLYELGGLLSNSQSTTNITVILCAYTEQRWDELGAAIRSLQSQTLLPTEIILIIDHNPALYQRACREITGIQIAENQSARGLSGARNTGIALSQGPILAFMDEDASAEPNWLALIAQAYRDPHVLGAGGAILPQWTGPRPAWFPEEFNWVVGCTYKGLPETAAPVRNLIGCNMSFRREIFEAAGGFKTGMGRVGTLPVGCEETELCIRASRHFPHQDFIYIPDARVWHRVPPSRTALRYFLDRCFSEGLSKAQVAHFVGAERGLASERAYSLHTLPRGVFRGLRDFFLHGDLSGVGRAFAIFTGLGLTTAGYAAGTVMDRFRSTPARDQELSGEVEY
jgi:GT2 family glycosyltransferase